MIYNTKIKNKNIAGVQIQSLLFSTLNQAERHCDKKNLYPDEAISRDPEEMNRIARNQIPELAYQREVLNDEWFAARKKLEIQINLRDEMRQNRDLLSSAKAMTADEKATELTGYLFGISFARELLDARIYELQRLLIALANGGELK